MRVIILAVFGLNLAWGAGVAAQAESYPQLVARLGGAGNFQGDVERLLLAKLNGLRGSKGLSRLAADGNFARAARAHALDMAQHNYLGHTSSTGLDFSGRMNALQGGQMRYAAMGENAAMMYPVSSASAVAERLFQSWLNSPPHLANMQKPSFTRVATGVVFLGGKAYADQIFTGAPLPPPASNRCSQSCISWH